MNKIKFLFILLICINLPFVFSKKRKNNKKEETEECKEFKRKRYCEEKLKDICHRNEVELKSNEDKKIKTFNNNEWNTFNSKCCKYAYGGSVEDMICNARKRKEINLEENPIFLEMLNSERNQLYRYCVRQRYFKPDQIVYVATLSDGATETYTTYLYKDDEIPTTTTEYDYMSYCNIGSTELEYSTTDIVSSEIPTTSSSNDDLTITKTITLPISSTLSYSELSTPISTELTSATELLSTPPTTELLSTPSTTELLSTPSTTETVLATHTIGCSYNDLNELKKFTEDICYNFKNNQDKLGTINRKRAYQIYEINTSKTKNEWIEFNVKCNVCIEKITDKMYNICLLDPDFNYKNRLIYKAIEPTYNDIIEMCNKKE